MPLSLSDRVFWSIALTILVGVLWVKFLEQYVTAWGALVVGLIIAILIMKFGGREFSLRDLISKAMGRMGKSKRKSD